MTKLPELLTRFNQDSTVQFSDIIRVICQHNEWLIPSKDGQPVLNQQDDEVHLNLYSDFEIFNTGVAEVEPIRRSNDWLFANFPDVNSIIIDAHSDYALQIPKQYFANLIRMFKAQRIEQCLSEQNNENWLFTLKDFPYYLLPIVNDHQGLSHIALAPDQQQRSLAAIFTAEDCAQRYMQAVGDKLGNVTMDLIEGTKLFHHLDMLPLNGLVFNCYGPAPMVAINTDTISQLASINRP